MIRAAGFSGAVVGSAPHRGRGFTIMRGLADEVETVRTTQGTRVTLRFDYPM
nr:ATP-binding protein [Nocardia uniformis]